MPRPVQSAGSNVPWRLVIGIGVVAVLGIIGFISTRGTTSASNLGIGDCFIDPGFGDVDRVEDQDCELPHEVQIFAELKDVPASQATTFAQGASSAGFRCEEELFRVLGELTDLSVEIPDDVRMGWLAEEGPSNVEVLCTIESPSGGLVGSVLGDG